MKFRYYITDLFDGTIKGTNDTQKVREMACCEDYFIVDTETGEWLNPGENTSVQEFGL